jgi:hypothetical protein
MIKAIALQDFYLNDILYRRGDLFTQPKGYPAANVFKLWVMAWIGDIDLSLLPDDLQAKAADTAWVQAERRRLECPQCG